MIKILNKQPGAKGFYTLTLSEDPKELELHQDTLIKFNGFHSKEISKETLEAMMAYDQIARAMQTAINKLSYRSYTPKRLYDELRRFQYAPSVINEVIERLKELKYINEEQRLTLMIEDFLHYELKGKKALNEQLKKEGFNPEAMGRAESLFTDEIELEKALTLLKQLYKTLKKTSVQKNQQRLTQKLYQRGFTEETIQTAISQFESTLKQHDETNALQETIIRYQKHYDLTNAKEKQKCIQKLLREGFSYNAIKDAIK